MLSADEISFFEEEDKKLRYTGNCTELRKLIRQYNEAIISFRAGIKINAIRLERILKEIENLYVLIINISNLSRPKEIDWYTENLTLIYTHIDKLKNIWMLAKTNPGFGDENQTALSQCKMTLFRSPDTLSEAMMVSSSSKLLIESLTKKMKPFCDSCIRSASKINRSFSNYYEKKFGGMDSYRAQVQELRSNVQNLTLDEEFLLSFALDVNGKDEEQDKSLDLDEKFLLEFV